MGEATYRDPLIELAGKTLTIRRYYFPTTMSRDIPAAAIAGASEIPIGRLTGRWRLWGSASPFHWLNLDLGRRHKSRAFVLDIGERVQPIVTPDDPAAFRRALEANGVSVSDP